MNTVMMDAADAQFRELTDMELAAVSGGANVFGFELDFQRSATFGGFAAFGGGVAGLGGGPLGVAAGAFAGFAGGFVGDLGVQIYSQWVAIN